MPEMAGIREHQHQWVEMTTTDDRHRWYQCPRCSALQVEKNSPNERLDVVAWEKAQREKGRL